MFYVGDVVTLCEDDMWLSLFCEVLLVVVFDGDLVVGFFKVPWVFG